MQKADIRPGVFDQLFQLSRRWATHNGEAPGSGASRPFIRRRAGGTHAPV